MPFDVAFSLSDEMMMAYSIVIGEQNGGKWDWNAMNWRKDD